MKLYLTGRPGIGKSTVVSKVIEKLKSHGITIGGIICPEVRGPRGQRIGFKIIDLLTNREGWLARKNTSLKGPRIGKYVVISDDAVNIGVKALQSALNNADVVVIDEVGPMELSIKELRNTIIDVLKSNKNVIAVVHHRLRDYQILNILRKYEKYEVTITSRNVLPSIMANKFLSEK